MRYGIPDFKMEKTIVDAPRRPDGGRGRHLPLQRPCRHRAADRRSCSRATTRLLCPAAPRSRATCRSRAASSTASTSPCSSCRSRTAASATSRSATSSRSSPAASTSSSSAAATPASDCIGTSIRQGALSVTQLEIMPKPPVKENKALTWPDWPLKLRTSSSQEEGAERDFAVTTHEFTGEDGRVTHLHLQPRRREDEADRGHGVRAQGRPRAPRHGLPRPGHRRHARRTSGSSSTSAATSRADTVRYRSSNEKVFACGDMRRGQTLVVWAIREGRQCARAIDELPDGRDGPAAVGPFLFFPPPFFFFFAFFFLLPVSPFSSSVSSSPLFCSFSLFWFFFLFLPESNRKGAPLAAAAFFLPPLGLSPDGGSAKIRVARESTRLRWLNLPRSARC